MNCIPRRASSINQEWQELPTAPNPDISRLVYFTALQHSGKNRYPDVLPFEKTRVILSNPDEYINANYIDHISEKGRFISTQAPLPQTFNTFWQMVWENKVPVIVMLTKIMEKRKIKAHCYWPALDETEVFGEIFVKLESEIQETFITIRHLSVQCGDEKRSVWHIQYTEWPDFGTPRSTSTIRHLLNLTDKYRYDYALDHHATVIVHCSAGIGRCGTFLAIQSVVEKIKSNVPISSISIKDIVASLRECRMAMVQTKEQYKFIYQVMEDFSLHTNFAQHTFAAPFANIRASTEDRSALTRSYSDLPTSSQGGLNFPLDTHQLSFAARP